MSIRKEIWSPIYRREIASDLLGDPIDLVARDLALVDDTANWSMVDSSIAHSGGSEYVVTYSAATQWAKLNGQGNLLTSKTYRFEVDVRQQTGSPVQIRAGTGVAGGANSVVADVGYTTPDWMRHTVEFTPVLQALPALLFYLTSGSLEFKNFSVYEL